MMRKRLLSLFSLLLTLCSLTLPARAELVQGTLPFYPYTTLGLTVERSYDSDTLKYVVETYKVGERKTKCFVTKVWMADPGRQIRKATAEWHKHLAMPLDMGKAIEGAALVINGSGYVSPMFPWIPETYPGTSEDYYFTPLGSLTVTNGEVFRNLAGIPYVGLTLEADGLHMYTGEDNETVLAHQPTQTWSFYEQCPLIQNHESILDRDWDFANDRAIRTIIAKMDDNNYLIFTVTSIHGLTLLEATDWLMEQFDPEWAYDLDGGPSTALICRNKGKKTLRVIYGGERKDVDVMAFVE